MGRRRGWIERLERRGAGHMISVKQRDGTTRTFLADDFWQQLFLSEVDAVVGRHNTSAASLAMENATEEARAEIRGMIFSEGGEFLKAATAGGFGIVGEKSADLSESREDRF